MRKHDVRKWLHAVLDLLPVFVIPLFMIFVRNENYNSSISIDAQQYKQVNFNQYINRDNNLTVNSSNATMSYDGSTNTVTVTSLNYGQPWLNGLRVTNNIFVTGHTYLFTFQSNYEYTYYNNTFALAPYELGVNEYYSIGSMPSSGVTFGVVGLPINVVGTFDVINLNVFDLTKMFGAGNEPTYPQFRSYYPNDYYAFTDSHIEIIDDYVITYNDTDVGSQMFYTLYNSVDKYFNMGNVFGLNDVYTWFSINIFGGNTSPAVYVVWQIVLYEFVMDLLFLLYGLFMWFIDMIQKLMEKPLDSVK